MRITLIAFGSRGDVQPHIALGAGLQAAGHDVRVVTHTLAAMMLGASAFGWLQREIREL